MKTTCLVLLASWVLSLTYNQLEERFATQYCQPQFRYCLQYPASLFPEQYFAPAGDSISMISHGRTAQVSVKVTPGAQALTPREIFEQRLQPFKAAGGRVLTISSIFDEHFYEVNFLCGDYSYHQRAGFYGTHYVVLSMQAPLNRPEVMQRVKEDVKILFD